MIGEEQVTNYWDMYGNQLRNDTHYHGHDESYTYVGTEYPELNGTVMTGHELNYMGVGAGFAAYDMPLWMAAQLTKEYYNEAHHQDPDLNVMMAMLAGYNAYNRHEGRRPSQCL